MYWHWDWEAPASNDLFQTQDVPDPYYGGANGFETVYYHDRCSGQNVDCTMAGCKTITDMPTLHLIPNTLGCRFPHAVLAPSAIEALKLCDRMIVESDRFARRLLKDAFPDESPQIKQSFPA